MWRRCECFCCYFRDGKSYRHEQQCYHQVKVSATSTQAGNGTFDIGVSSAMGMEMNVPSTTSPGLQISPTSSAASVCGGGKFVEVTIKALVAMGSVEFLWGMI
jgi:hypothetical protein